MTLVPRQLRELVVARAESRCEYYGLAQEGQEATFHVDHVIPTAGVGDSIGHSFPLPGAFRSRDGGPLRN